MKSNLEEYSTRKIIVRQAFLKIKGIKVDPLQNLAEFKCITASCPGFRLRILEVGIFKDNSPSRSGNGCWVLELGVKKDFDRWANSTNFEQEILTVTEINFSNLDFNAAIRQARRVVKSQAFNWNSYFDTISLDAGIKWEKA